MIDQEMNSLIKKKAVDFSKDILGPILYDFCAKLHWHLEQNVVQEQDDSRVLFMARAGLRLHYLYQLYRQLNNLPLICLESDLYISRLSCVKGCLTNDFDYVSSIIVEEYKNKPIVDVFRRIIDIDLCLASEWQNIPTSDLAFRQIYGEDSKNSQIIADYFRQQSQLFKQYIQNFIQHRKRIFLVDSGWTGRTQAMLMRAFPEVEWTGLYFGKWAYGKSPPEHFPSIVGLCLDDSIHHPGHPRASLFHYHHLIEDPLEINFPSVRGYHDSETAPFVMPDTGIASQSVIEYNGVDIHFRGIIEYFKSCQQNDLDQISQEADLAYKKLNHLIRFPSKSDLLMMTVGDRSADFGKKESYPILLQPCKGGLIAKRRRLIRCLWKEGQIALEFPPIAACIIQRIMNYSSII